MSLFLGTKRIDILYKLLRFLLLMFYSVCMSLNLCLVSIYQKRSVCYMAGLFPFPLVCPFWKSNAHIVMLCKQEEMGLRAGDTFSHDQRKLSEGFITTIMMYLSYISAKRDGFEFCLMIIHQLSYSVPSYCFLMVQNYPEFIEKQQMLTII